MSTDTTEGTRLATMSGAQVRPTSAGRARMFLACLDQPTSERVDLALGAYEDDDTLIGVAVLNQLNSHATGLVAVTPSRRHLGIGGDLLHALRDAAAARGIHSLTCRRWPTAPATNTLASAHDRPNRPTTTTSPHNQSEQSANGA